MQSALFPVLRIEHDWVSVDVGYRAGDSRMALGGDFYDVCSRPTAGSAWSSGTSPVTVPTLRRTAQRSALRGGR